MKKGGSYCRKSFPPFVKHGFTIRVYWGNLFCLEGLQGEDIRYLLLKLKLFAIKAARYGKLPEKFLAVVYIQVMVWLVKYFENTLEIFSLFFICQPCIPNYFTGSVLRGKELFFVSIIFSGSGCFYF